MNFYFIMVPLRKKVLKYGTPKPSNYLGFSVGREKKVLKYGTPKPSYGGDISKGLGFCGS